MACTSGAAKMCDGAFEVTVCTGGMSCRTNTHSYNTYEDPAIKRVTLRDFDTAGSEIIEMA